jgi:hypothetical protein
MYLIRVAGDVQSSNRTEYPTSCPTAPPRSCATRCATDIAATCMHVKDLRLENTYTARVSINLIN